MSTRLYTPFEKRKRVHDNVLAARANPTRYRYILQSDTCIRERKKNAGKDEMMSRSVVHAYVSTFNNEGAGLDLVYGQHKHYKPSNKC